MICPLCNGVGERPKWLYENQTCPLCDGKKEIDFSFIVTTEERGQRRPYADTLWIGTLTTNLDYAKAKTTWLKAYDLTDGKVEWYKEKVEKFSYESTVDGLNVYSFQTRKEYTG